MPPHKVSLTPSLSCQLYLRIAEIPLQGPYIVLSISFQCTCGAEYCSRPILSHCREPRLSFFLNLSATGRNLQEVHHHIWQHFGLLLAAPQTRFLRHTNTSAHCFSKTLLRCLKGNRIRISFPSVCVTSAGFIMKAGIRILLIYVENCNSQPVTGYLVFIQH